jgi:hypothetical protein
LTTPIPGEILATVRSYPELVEAFRTIKARLGLSNDWCDQACDWAGGFTDKVLGPTQNKNISPLTFSMLCQIFAVKFTMEIDMDAVRKMEATWQKRAERNVRIVESRISQKLIERAKPHVFSEMGKRGGPARAACLTDKHRSKIARKAAKSRWKKHRKSRCVASASSDPPSSSDGKSSSALDQNTRSDRT